VARPPGGAAADTADFKAADVGRCCTAFGSPADVVEHDVGRIAAYAVASG
jgi:hypothetical protein